MSRQVDSRYRWRDRDDTRDIASLKQDKAQQVAPQGSTKKLRFYCLRAYASPALDAPASSALTTQGSEVHHTGCLSVSVNQVVREQRPSISSPVHLEVEEEILIVKVFAE